MGSASPQPVSVLVVGAGPVGLVLACELARREVPVRVIDKLPEPTDESRAIVVHARSLEMMERIGVVEPLIASGLKTTAMEFHAGGELLGRVEFDIVDSPFPFSVSTAQTETERVLTGRLAALGVGVERGVELTGFEQDEDGVRSTLRHADGSTEVVTSGWIAGTDGSHSAVRAQLGAELEGSFKGERFLLGDVEADHVLDRDSMHTFFADGKGPLAVFPMLGQRLRVIAQIDERGPEAEAEPTLSHLQAVVDERAQGIAMRDAHWLTIFEIHHAQVPKYRHGRAFLAGDAAHVHSPAGGQGMNTGMQDAFNLGWKLALAAGGHGAPGLLDSYQVERHPVAARVIKQSTMLTQVATVRHDLIRKLRNFALHVATGLSPVSTRLVDQVEETDIAYRQSPIVLGAHGGRHSVHPGDAAPDVPGLGLHRVLARGTGHAGLYIAPAGAATPVTAAGISHHVLVGDTAADGAGFDDVVADPERKVSERYGVGDAGGLVLIRPDGYVGLMAQLGDDGAVVSYRSLVLA